MLHRIAPLTPPAALSWLPDRLVAHRLARQVFPDAGHVTTHGAVRTPGGLLVVRVDRDAGPSVAVKHALRARAARTLEQERRVLQALAVDPRASGAVWRLLPTEVACQLDGPLPLVAETWLPGVDAGTALHRDPRATARITATALAALGELHAATGRPEYAAAFLKPWVDDRVDVLTREIGWCRTEAGTAALAALRDRLRRGLAGRTLAVGWTHGDFAAGNILLAEDRATVTGVIDWSTACPDGPVAVDAYTLVLTSQYELSGMPLGRVIADIVRAGRLPSAQRALLNGAFEADAVLLALLTWLWHVSNNTAKSERYGRSSRWVHGNVIPVLEAAAP